MGKLSDFDLSKYISDFNIKVLIETGAGTGTGISYALQFPFHKIFSCDIDSSQVFKLNHYFRSELNRLTILPNKSDDFLKIVLEDEYIKKEESIIFFLDAHFPSADLGKKAYDDEKDLTIRLPLETELSIIRENRKGKRDIIIIDDWRIYEKLDFHGGDLEQIGYGHITQYIHSDFLKEWEKTHIVSKILQDTGYVLMMPK